jgi:hypothetical protein
MTDWPQPDAASLNAFYGNPDRDNNGVADRAWEDANLVNVAPPYRMVLSWAPLSPVKTIRVHRKCADSLLRALTGIRDHYGTQVEIERLGLHLYGGSYNFRLKRGGSTLSNHSWGGAIDINPAKNGLGVKWDESKGMMPHAVVDVFAAEGWAWGGRWKIADAMHFEAVAR